MPGADSGKSSRAIAVSVHALVCRALRDTALEKNPQYGGRSCDGENQPCYERAVGECSDLEQQEERGQPEAERGNLRPDPHANELLARAVFLDPHENANSAKEAAARLEIPAVEVAAATDESSCPLQGVLQ